MIFKFLYWVTQFDGLEYLVLKDIGLVVKMQVSVVSPLLLKPNLYDLDFVYIQPVS